MHAVSVLRGKYMGIKTYLETMKKEWDACYLNFDESFAFLNF